MKRLLLGLLTLLALGSHAQTTPTAGWEKIKRTLKDGTVQRGWVRRSLVTYPQSTGNPAFYALVNSGATTFTFTDPFSQPTGVFARYTLSDGLLYIEAGGDVGQLKFERIDNVAMTGTNPDNVPLKTGVFYGYGSNSSPPFDKQWKAKFSPSVVGQTLKLTFKQTTGNTFVYTFATPTNGVASGVLLFGKPTGGVTTIPPSSTTTTPASSSALAFQIVDYNCNTGVLQYKFTGGNGGEIAVNIPGLVAGSAIANLTLSVTFPSDARTGRAIFGSASQGATTIPISFITSCSLGPTVTPPPSTTVTTPTPSTYVAANYNYATGSTYIAPGDSMNLALTTFETPYQKAVVALARRWGNNGGNSITGPRLSGQIYQHYYKAEPNFSLPMYLHYSTQNPGEYSFPIEGQNFTMGTQYGVGNCIYMNPKPNIVSSTVGEGIPDYRTTGLGRNPNPGDDRGNTSLLLQYWKFPDRLGYYIKTVPVLYNAYGALALGTTYEDWHDFADHLHVVHSRITTNYTLPVDHVSGYGKQPYLYDGEQEMPGKYVNGSFDDTGVYKNKVIIYTGGNPCTGDQPTVIDVSQRYKNGQIIWTSMRTEAYRVTEPFIFVSSSGNANAKGTGLILSVSKIRIGNFGSGDSRPDRISPNTNTTYISEKPDIQFEDNGVVYSVYKEFFGTLAEIRAEGCKVENRFKSTPNYRFNTAEKQNWKLSTWGDSPVLGGGFEKRMEDFGAQDIADKSYWHMKANRSPYSNFSLDGVAFKASEFNKVYIRMAYTGQNSTWGFSWVRNQQKPSGDPSDTEEQQAFPKGKAPVNQSVTFPVIGDGVVRTYVVDLSNHPLWNPFGNDYIQFMQFSPHASGTTSGTEDIKVYGISSDPNSSALFSVDALLTLILLSMLIESARRRKNFGVYRIHRVGR